MRPLDELLTGLCVHKLAQILIQKAGIRCACCGDIKEKEIERLVGMIADYPVEVRGVKGFDNAQVTAGGIATGEFDPDTMASRLAPGIHAAGEVLDVDGDCGGFNLMFAFGSGILAGMNGRKGCWR